MTLPLQQPVAIFLVVLVIILLGPLLFRLLKIPTIVGMILAGMAVGPYGFNILSNDASFKIFGEVGILYIMFLAAAEIDMFHLRKQIKSGILFGLLSFMIPMVMGIFGAKYAFSISWTSAVLVASMYASHTLISYPVVSRFGLSNSRGAVIAVSGTIIAVMLALLALAEVVTVRVSGIFSWSSLGRLALMLVIYVLAVGYSFPWLTRRFFRYTNDSVSQFIFILALVFVGSLLAQLIGLEAILGAFYAGLVLNRLIPSRSALMGRIRFVGNAIFIPYFLIGVGMLINIGVIFKGWGVAWVAANMVVVALGGKWLAAWLSQKLLRLDSLDRKLMFGLTSGKAAATIAATIIGFRYGLLTENVMNAAVVMILVCCIVSTVVTDRTARRLRILLTRKELENESAPTANFEARQLVAVSNPLTSEGLMKMALLMRSMENHEQMTCLFVRTNDDANAITMGRNAMRAAVGAAIAVDVDVRDVERWDINVVSGVNNVIKETRASDVIIGLHRKSNVVDTFYGTMIENLLSATNKMIFMSRVFIPVDTVRKIFVVAPLNAEYEVGFRQWVDRIGNLASQIGSELTVISYAATCDFIRRQLADEGFGVRQEYRVMESWDDFILLSGEITEEDLLMVVAARKGSVSHNSELETLPNFLSRNFSRHNLVVVYPEQFRGQ